ncbi:hypothetical protein [Burkholderia multivorans]|uniref:hypothetical protein n=1 Tax=Burkholderia multivorans TaxID=87883 RepID=UPI00075D683C|nr:hypothetical protein [Burkholderia multivorans]KVZ24587.1 hypothetical protein WL15_24105 [Burkholderia multivorans]KWH23203.1 hypothetical protein WL98_14275 [Burkholderia multivorans]MBR7890786.1 hypothetical protein [Burkholderia multivorans]MBR8453493.1 hypothetical protein [Burkholderia multivorans]MBU9143669.1 hypothetical protein [Burkholderia multivorans]
MRIGMGIGACAVVLAACSVGTPPLSGNWRAPSFVDLQTACGGTARDWGADAQPVYSALYDAYVAKRYRGLSQANYCAFVNELSAHYAAPDAPGRAGWIAYLNGARAQAVSWRAAVDPTLRGG